MCSELSSHVSEFRPFFCMFFWSLLLRLKLLTSHALVYWSVSVIPALKGFVIG